MTIRNLYPTTRPTLNLDFANSKRLDPRITFTRSSTGTYVGSDGLIKSAATNEARFDHNPSTGESLGLLVEESRTNSYQYGSNFDNSYWTKSQVSVIPNNGLAPDGTITASKVVPDTANVATHYITKDRGAGNPATETFTIYAKSSGYSYLLVASTDTNNQFRVNLNDGSIDSKGATVVSSSTVSTQSVGNGWWRVTYSVSSNQLRYISLIPVPQTITSYTQSFSGDGISGVLIWGAQVESGSFPTSYIPTPATFTSRASTATYYDASGVIQTASSNVARSAAFFPDSNGVMRSAGLLLEAAGTNLVTYSEQFDNAAWNKNGTSVTANTNVAPDGTTTADTITGSSGSYPSIYQSATLPSTGIYQASCYFRKTTGATVFPALEISFAPGSVIVILNTNTGVATNSAGSALNMSVTNVGNYWRLSFGANVNITNATLFVYPCVSANGTTISSGLTGSCIAWGAQLEASPYATSYIPTTTATVTRAADVSSSATVTRSADVASITGTNFSSWYNQSEGTFLSVLARLGSPTSGNISAVIGGANPNITSSSYHTLIGNGNAQITSSGGANYVFSLSAVNAHKLINAYATNNFNAAYNGNLLTLDTSYSPPTCTQLVLAGIFPIADNTGRISRLAYYPVRLTDAQLQALTT